MKKRWSDENVRICPIRDLSLSRRKPHAQYRLISKGKLFDIVLFQEVFPQKSSSLHFHPGIEILIVLSDNFIIETDKGEKEVPQESIVYIPPNVIHRVENNGPESNTESILLIGEDYREEDVVYVEKRKDEWIEVSGE